MASLFIEYYEKCGGLIGGFTEVTSVFLEFLNVENVSVEETALFIDSVVDIPNFIQASDLQQLLAYFDLRDVIDFVMNIDNMGLGQGIINKAYYNDDLAPISTLDNFTLKTIAGTTTVYFNSYYLPIFKWMHNVMITIIVHIVQNANIGSFVNSIVVGLLKTRGGIFIYDDAVVQGFMERRLKHSDNSG